MAIDALMAKQSQSALHEADLVFFLVDGRAGLNSVDEHIATALRKLSKPIYLIVNKSDGLDEDTIALDFQSLGLSQVFAISSSHGRGIQPLLKAVTETFPEASEESDFDGVIKIAFIGRPNVGKSTLVNRILGEDRVVVYDMPGTTRDSISIPFTRGSQKYTLIDTAGIRRRARVDEKIEKFSVVKTLQSIKGAHVCVMLFDAKDGLSDQDLHLLSFIIDAGTALVIAVNKWDDLTPDHKAHIRKELDRRMQFVQFAKIRFISALHGTGVSLLFKDILQAYQSATQSLSTPQVTRLLQDLVAKHEPPLVSGRRIKMRYAHAGGQNPPVIVIHGNQLDSLPDSYRRYLAKGFTEHLKLVGTPLKLEFKSTVNPYKDKKNKLSERQIHRKRRLMKHVKKG